MADNKKYYYLKLKEGFFESDELKILQSMPDGYLYSDILMKLYLRSLRNGGRLMYKDVIPYTSSILATLTGHQVGTVEKAVDTLKKLGLIEVLDNGAIYMMDIQNFIGQSSTEADRKRDYRSRIDAEKNALLSNTVGQMSGRLSVQNEGQMSGQLEDKSTPEIRDKRLENRDINNINTFARRSDRQTSKPEEKTETSVAGHVRPSLKADAGQQSNEVCRKSIPEQEADVEPLILNDGSEWKPTEALFAEYVRLYPKVDVKQQFNEMRGWCLSNPHKRKTRRGITRFVNGWLSREQNKGGNSFRTASNRFNQFQKNDYDISDIERKFLANGGDAE